MEPQVALELEHSLGFTTNSQGVAFHPDTNRSMIAFSCGKLLCISDLDDAHEQRLFSGHDAAISALDVSPTGTYIASGQEQSVDGVVYFNVWEFHTGQIVSRIQTPHKGRIDAIRYSADEAMIATTGSEGSLVIWEASTGKAVATFKDSISNDQAKSLVWGHTEAVGTRDQQYTLYVAFNTGVRLCTLSFSIKKLQFELNAVACQLPGSGGRMGGFVRRYLCCSYVGNDLLCGTSSGDLVVYNATGGHYRTSLTLAANGVTSIVANNLHNCLFIGGGDGKLRKVSGCEKQWQLDGEVQLEGSIVSIALSADDHQLVVQTTAGLMYRVLCANLTFTVAAEAPLGGLRDTALSPESAEVFATVSNDGFLRVWNLSTYTVTSQFCLSTNGRTGQAADVPTPTSCAFDAEPNHVVVGWSDGRIRCINCTNQRGELAWTMPNGHKGAVHTVKVCPLYVATGGEDSTIRIWSRGTKELMSQLQSHKLPTTGILIDNSTTSILHTFSLDMSLLAFDLSKQDLHANVKAPKQVALHTYSESGGFTCATQRPNHEHEIIVGTVDGTILVYDLDYPQPVILMQDSNKVKVSCCEMSPDGRHFVAGLADGSILVYEFSQTADDKPTTNLVLQAVCHSGQVVKTCFTSDGKQVVSAGSDGELIVWNFYSR